MISHFKNGLCITDRSNNTPDANKHIIDRDFRVKKSYPRLLF